jgi:hypothetical protein
MNSYSLSGSEVNRNITMRTIKSGVAAALGTAALVATFTLTGGTVANAASATPTPTDTASQSCWLDADSGQSLCVPLGVNLISTVESVTGETIDVPVGTTVGNFKTTSAQASASSLKVNAASSLEALSALYDDINYGGGTYLMTGDDCGGGIANIGNFGWNDRASSFQSFSGCLTAVYKDINYGSTRLGYSTNKASFGTMNDAASSWRTE